MQYEVGEVAFPDSCLPIMVRKWAAQMSCKRDTVFLTTARSTAATALLDNLRTGVVEPYRRGRIMAVNDRARGILRRDDAGHRPL